jgi:hypothetical protein
MSGRKKRYEHRNGMVQRTGHEGNGQERVSANMSSHNRSVLWSQNSGQDKKSARRELLHELYN